MFYGYQEQTNGWGSASYPREAAEHMQLAEHLKAVPSEGVVVDVGAGINLSLASFIGVTRPDITTISIDPGYGGQFSCKFSATELSDTLDTFEPCQQLWLRSSRDWRSAMIASAAEDIPLPDEVADLVVSYAVVPEHAWDVQGVVSESLRILKLGATAVFGPFTNYHRLLWDEVLESPAIAEQVTEQHDTHMIIRPWGSDVDVSFSTLRK